jgi:pyruvate carboxylase subunit A
MQAIMSREKPLEEKLSQVFDDSKRAAAVAAAIAYTQMMQQKNPRGGADS